MTYPYSSEDRLLHPHSYMYTSFEGREFLDSYISLRKGVLDDIYQAIATPTALDDFYRELLNYGMGEVSGIVNNSTMNEYSKKLSLLSQNNPVFSAENKLSKENSGFIGKMENLKSLSVDKLIETKDVLVGVLGCLMTDNGASALVKEWMDRLTQRFEINKKIYAAYKPGFRKGEGGYDDLALYALFALSTAVYYHQNHNLKYLNVLLKINDTLCSVVDRVTDDYPVACLGCLALTCEITYIEGLLSGKGIQYATN